MKRMNRWVMMALLIQSPVIQVAGQGFWLLTNEFHGGPKTGISVVQDSLIYAGLADGLIRSNNEGNTFEIVFTGEPVHSLFAAENGSLFLGSEGRIFYSDNDGETWDTASLETGYPVVQIVGNREGDIFAITGAIVPDSGYMGDGVFFSDDNGRNWEKRNGGLGGLLGCERIAVDGKGRLYLTTMNEYMTAYNGLYTSDDSGLTWKRKKISIDGRGVFEGTLTIMHTTGLSVSPEDTVFLSFYGIATNALVQLNLMNHIDDVWNEERWSVYEIFDAASWWLDWPLNNIFFSTAGSRYSSNNGNFRTGFTWFRKAGNSEWEQTDGGLGLSKSGTREIQHFAGTSGGRIFMVQLGDERIYTRQEQSDPSVIPSDLAGNGMGIYPNPAGCSQEVIVDLSFPEVPTIELYDLSGRKTGVVPVIGEFVRFTAPCRPGIYFIRVLTRATITSCRLVVY